MLVAALADIHGNLPALEAVLAELEREEVDAVVVAGDTISGPWPVETFELVVALGARVVRGNADRLVVEGGEGALGLWSARRLGERLARAGDWPVTAELEVDGLGHLLVCHSTPSDDEVIYTRITPDVELDELLRGVDADVVVSGHTHIQFDRTLPSGLRVVNPGSVGLPYEGRVGAYWALLGPDVELRRTDYDVESTVSAIRELDAPVPEELLGYLTDPLDPETATAEFEKLRGA